ncbi:transposase domain-containing protein [Streptomyces sp. PA03-2a]|uniref:transposase domain-containing protein n=1 Tax=Streptomyces sp. PA03-2a TaxID=3028701 RepID=UPI0039F69AD0
MGLPDVGSGAPVELAVDQDNRSLTGGSAVRTVCHHACRHGGRGLYAPGHLGELTRIVPFELVDAVLVECGTVQQRLRKLPAWVVVYLLLAAALFEDCGYREVWRKLTGALVGLPLVEVTATALWHARCRLGVRPVRALFDLLRGPACAIRTTGARWKGLLVVAIPGRSRRAARRAVPRVRGLCRVRRGVGGW